MTVTTMENIINYINLKSERNLFYLSHMMDAKSMNLEDNIYLGYKQHTLKYIWILDFISNYVSLFSIILTVIHVGVYTIKLKRWMIHQFYEQNKIVQMIFTLDLLLKIKKTVVLLKTETSRKHDIRIGYDCRILVLKIIHKRNDLIVDGYSLFIGWIRIWNNFYFGLPGHRKWIYVYIKNLYRHLYIYIFIGAANYSWNGLFWTYINIGLQLDL